MLTPTIIFAHGRESGPWGVKIRALAKVAEALGCRVISRDDQDTRDPQVRVKRLVEQAQDCHDPLILVGSSMGGYVVTAAAARLAPRGLFLMAPAFGLEGYPPSPPRLECREITIVHGWDDEVIPEAAVLSFARDHRARCHLLPASHHLHEQLADLTCLFRLFLERLLVHGSDRRSRLAAIY